MDILTKIESERCKRDFYYFVMKAFPHVEGNTQQFKASKVYEVICNYFQNIENAGRYVVNVPPSVGKSTIISILYPVWCWINDPSQKIFSVSYTPALSISQSNKSLQLMLSQWFQERWPYIKFNRPKQLAKNDYQNTSGGRRLSTSIGSKIIGFHADKILIDDPNKADDSKNQHLDTQDWFRNSLPTRLIDQQNGIIVLIQQRLDEDDVSSYCLSNNWKSLILPMEFDPDRKDPLDWRQEKDELLIPERMNRTSLDKLKLALGNYSFAQLQQNPVNPFDRLFKEDLFKYIHPDYSLFKEFIISWDLAVYAKDTSDYSVGILGAKTDNGVVILDESRWKADFNEAVINIKNYHDMVEASLKKKGIQKSIKMIIENKANGPAIVSALRQNMKNIEEINVGNKSKFDRAQILAYHMRMNEVFYSYDMKEEFINEIMNFPKLRYDDRVDAVGQLVSYSLSKKAGIWDLIKQNNKDK